MGDSVVLAVLAREMESPTGGEPRKTTVEKKLHALKKLIQSVDALNEKQRAGATLDAQQRAKLARAPALAAEVAHSTAEAAHAGTALLSTLAQLNAL